MDRMGIGRCCAAAFCWMTLLGTAARAVVITNQNTNTVLFSDNFESGDLLHPAAGTWTLGPSSPGVSVTNAASPGAAEGNFYADSFRQTQFTIDEGNMQASFTEQTTVGDVVLLRMMVYLPGTTDTDARAQFMLDDGDFGSARAWVRPDGSGHVIAVGPGFALTDTGLTYATDKWQEWDLSYAIGGSTFSVSVNGSTATGLSSFTTGGIAHADLLNGAWDPAGSFFLDAVPASTSPGNAPEPGSLWLAGVAALAGFSRMRGIRFAKMRTDARRRYRSV